MGLVQALEGIAQRQPQSPALTWRTTTWTYGELRAASATIERALARRDVPRGTRVALLLRNSPHYVAAYYGTLASACVAVPLNVHERAPVLIRQIENCGAQILIGDVAHPEWGAVTAAARSSSIEVIGLKLDGDELVAAFQRELEGTSGLAASKMTGDIGEHELASIIYTSGTTGSPKGVMLSHGNLHANADAIIRSLGLNEHDHMLCVLPFYFSYGNSVLHSHLLCGARLTLEDNLAFPRLILQRLQDDRISGFAGVPSTFALLLGRHRLEDFDLSHLRYVTQAGGPMPRALLDELRKGLAGVRVFVMYGQTEATARLTCLPPEDLDRKPGSVGLPISGVEIDVREAGRPLPPHGVGEIFVRGPNVMLGYWNDAAATAEVLRDGWLRTRDLGYLDGDGYLYLVGRTTDMLKIGAFRVSPQEIEEVLASIEGVEEAAVVAIPDEILGQAVKAFIVPRPDAALSAMSVKAHCRAHLATYKIPKAVEFISALPKTSSGKIQRFKLAGAESTNDS